METGLMAGVSRVTITPPLDRPLVGGVDDVTFKGVLDDLYVRALVLDDGRREIAIVSADIIGVPYEVTRDIVTGVEAFCGIPADRVTVSATHTHSGPRLDADQADYYTEFFEKQVVTAVYVAKSNKQPVRIGVGRAKNRDYVFNRRLRKPDGTIVMNWVDSDFTQDCRGDGTVDPEMIVVKIEAANGSPLCFVMNYANHNNAVVGGVVSADIFGYMGTLMRRLYGDDVVTLCLLGPCGNTNWLDYRIPSSQRWGTTYHKQIATGLTGTMLEIVAKMAYPGIIEIDSVHDTIQIPERPFVEYDTKEDLTYGELDGYYARRFFEGMHQKAKRESEGKPLDLYDLDMHVVCIGDDISLVTFPCELFAEYGLEIKSRSPFEYTMVTELTNGTAGYAPTQAAYEEGGYEVRKPANKMERGAGEQMTAVNLQLLEQVASK